MKRWLVGSTLAVIAGGLGMYVINADGTASLDSRAR
jgi:hypothetical protein